MSAWSEAVYVIRELQKSLGLSEDITKLKNRKNIIAKAGTDGSSIVPVGDYGIIEEDSFWMILDNTED